MLKSFVPQKLIGDQSRISQVNEGGSSDFWRRGFIPASFRTSEEHLFTRETLTVIVTQCASHFLAHFSTYGRQIARGQVTYLTSPRFWPHLLTENCSIKWDITRVSLTVRSPDMLDTWSAGMLVILPAVWRLQQVAEGTTTLWGTRYEMGKWCWITLCWYSRCAEVRFHHHCHLCYVGFKPNSITCSIVFAISRAKNWYIPLKWHRVCLHCAWRWVFRDWQARNSTGK